MQECWYGSELGQEELLAKGMELGEGSVLPCLSGFPDEPRRGGVHQGAGCRARPQGRDLEI